MRRVAVILISCLFAVQALAQSKKNKKPLPVFTINKKTVTADEFIYLYRKNHPDKPDEFTTEKIQEYLELFINFKLKVQEARTRGLDTTAAFRKEFASYKEELRKPYLPDNRISDSLARMTYERMKEEIKASHILINVKKDASPADTLAAYTKITTLRKRALAGENFNDLAVQYSEDPSVKTNKGTMIYFSAFQMVFPFENAAYNTPVGQISEPVRTQFGYHVVKVEDRRPSRGEVEVSHIMLTTGQGADIEKARNTIFEVYDKLRGGVKWEDLVKEYSEDSGSKDSGGRLKPFSPGAMAAIPAFEQAAFALRKSGDISDPFQSQYGWHIVRLENKIPLQPYDELATALKSKVNRDERTQISKQAQQLKLRRDFGFRETPGIRAKVFSLADTSFRRGKWKVPAGYSSSETLFSFQNKGTTTKEFFSYVLKNQRANVQAPEKYMESLYNNFVDANISQLLEDKIVKQNPDFRMLLNEYYEGILLFDIMEKEVWNKASEDSVGQEKYFLANRGKYMAGERARAVVFSASSADVLDQLKQKIAAGDTASIDDFKSRHAVRQERGGYERSDKPVFAKVSWSKGLFPVENNGMYYLVWIKDIRPPGQKTFQEARPSVISDYQTELEKTWIATLKKKYPVKLNEKGKTYVFSKLQQR